MPKYSFKINLAANGETEAKNIATLLQQTVAVIDKDDLTRLLTKVVNSPSIVKTALKFI